MNCKNCGEEITDGSDGFWIDDYACAWCDDGKMHEPEKDIGRAKTNRFVKYQPSQDEQWEAPSDDEWESYFGEIKKKRIPKKVD